MLSSFYALTIPPAAPVASRVLKAGALALVGNFPEVATREVLAFGLNFSDKIGASDSVISATAAVAAYSGADISAASLASADPIVSGNQVNQMLGPNWVSGRIYTWTVTVRTALGETLVNFAHIPCTLSK